MHIRPYLKGGIHEIQKLVPPPYLDAANNEYECSDPDFTLVDRHKLGNHLKFFFKKIDIFKKIWQTIYRYAKRKRS